MPVAPEKEVAKFARHAQQEFDNWLKRISGGHITLDRLITFAGGTPILGNIIAAIDTILAVRSIYNKGLNNADAFDWLELTLNFIGVIPALGNAVNVARRGMRPLLHLAKDLTKRGVFKNGKNNQLVGEVPEALATIIVNHIASNHLGDPEKFVTTFKSNLNNILNSVKQTGVNSLYRVANALDSILDSTVGKFADWAANGKLSTQVKSFSSILGGSYVCRAPQAATNTTIAATTVILFILCII